MSIKLEQEIIEAFADKGSIKVLASTDKNGIPHVVFKESLQITKDGKILYLEIIETSKTNKNLVTSIWFNKQVAINVLTKDKKSYQVKGIPIKADISGHLFQEYYIKVKESIGTDLSTVWIIEPVEVIEQTFKVRVNEEEEKHPLLPHLDRLLK